MQPATARPDEASASDDVRRWSAAAILADVYAVLVALFAIHAGIVALRSRYTVPVRDDWRILDEMFSRPLLQWLWADQNGHRIPGTLMLIFADQRWLDGRMLLPVAVSVLGTGVVIAALVATVPAPDRRRPFERALLAFACFGFVSAGSHYDFTWGLQEDNIASAGLVILAAAAFGRAGAGVRDGRPALHPLLLAGLAAAGATFSDGAGFSAWAGLVAAALLIRSRSVVPAGIALAAAACLVVYAHGLEHAGDPSRYGRFLLHEAAPLATMVGAYLGSPVMRVVASFVTLVPPASYSVSVGAGTVGMALAAIGSVLLARHPERVTARQTAGVAIVAAAGASGLLVALNRFPWTMNAVDVRFVTWSALFWIGLVCMLPAPTDALGPIAVAGVVLLALASAAMWPALAQERARHDVDVDRATMSANLHLLGIQWDAASIGTIFGASPDRSYRVVVHLRAGRRAMFAGRDGTLPDAPLSDRFTVVPGTRCRGGVLWRSGISTRLGPAGRIAGWTSEASRPPALAAVITDARGIIRGLASHVTRLEELVTAPLPPVDHAWLGAIAEYDDRLTYHVFVVRADGQEVCEVAVLVPPTAG